MSEIGEKEKERDSYVTLAIRGIGYPTLNQIKAQHNTVQYRVYVDVSTAWQTYKQHVKYIQ